MNAKAKHFFFPSENHNLLGTLGSILLFESLIFGKGHGGRHQNQGGEGEDHASQKPHSPETNVLLHTTHPICASSLTVSCEGDTALDARKPI